MLTIFAAPAFRKYKLIHYSYRLDSHEGAANAIVQLQGANMGGRPVKVRRRLPRLLVWIRCLHSQLT
jgi:hypothetical protein